MGQEGGRQVGGRIRCLFKFRHHQQENLKGEPQSIGRVRGGSERQWPSAHYLKLVLRRQVCYGGISLPTRPRAQQNPSAGLRWGAQLGPVLIDLCA